MLTLRTWLVASVVVVAGCGPSPTVETPKEPIRELPVKPSSGPPAGLAK